MTSSQLIRMLLLVLSISSITAQKIHIAFLWHMHQPTYFPGETILETEASNHYDYSVHEIHTNRTGPYTAWPANAVQAGISEGMGHFGAQVSLSGSLMDNLDLLESSGVGNFTNWKSHWTNISTQSTALGNPRLDLVGFGYNHPLMALIPDEDIESQILRHRQRLEEAFSSPVSKGIFPPENAFASHMIPALVETGLEWVLVDNIHFERATQDYPFSTSANLVEPNTADQLNANPMDWQNLNDLWCPTQISGQWAHQPHYTEYVDPETGESSRMIAVPASRYIGNEDGRGGFGALQYEQVLSQLESANTDADHPILVVIAHDGDNHGGGTDSYYQNNFDQFITWLSNNPDRFECTTIQDYLDRFPPDLNDVIHIEPGSWSGADNGDPEFKKWNSDPNEEGYSPDRTSWAVITAANNLVKTAQNAHPNNSDVIQAMEHLHTGQSSDYWYWDWAQGGIWDTHPTRAANLATALVAPLLANLNDSVGPTIFLPQRQAFNPGGYEWTLGQPSDFIIWTLVHDHSAISSIVVKIREDDDGINDPMTTSNELYVGGPGVGAWLEVNMVGSDILPQTNIVPHHISQEFTAIVNGYSNTLLDYYVEATDEFGNVSRSPIQHVFVGNQAGAGSGTYLMDGVVDDVPELISENDLTLYADFNGEDLYVAGPSAPAIGQDVFILISELPQSMLYSPWAKAGEVANWDAFLANESTNNWGGWFDQDGRVELATGTNLEGLIRVSEQWPDLPDSLFLALATYSTEDGGTLVQQLPQGNGDENIDADEYTTFVLDYSGVGVDQAYLPTVPTLGRAYPNPFNPEVTFTLSLPKSVGVKAQIFDIRGRLVKILIDEELSAGVHRLSWLAKDQASGIYLIRFTAGDFTGISRVVLNR